MRQTKDENMAGKVHFDLWEQLDQYPQGFDQTPSGVEMKILERLFSDEGSEMFLELSLMPETDNAVAQRTNRDSAEVAELLEQMVGMGLIFRLKKALVARPVSRLLSEENCYGLKTGVHDGWTTGYHQAPRNL